jgi:hypothetical protein
MVNDTSHGGGNGAAFNQSGSGLQLAYVGSTSTPEQALSLAPASSFSTVFGVGDTLVVYSSVPASSTQLDFGLAISANNPVGGTTDLRGSFDWASISIRPTGTGGVGDIRENTSISGSVVSSSVAGINATLPVDGLYITWASPLQFTFGYIDNTHTMVMVNSKTFNPGSTIGSQIGFYGDIRATGTSIGDFYNLSIISVPEPSALAMCSMGLFGFATLVRRKK